MQNQLLKGRFDLDPEKRNQGGFARIYEALDKLSDKQVVIKVNSKERIHDRELQILMLVTQKKLMGFPKLIDDGKLYDNFYYMALEKLGPNLGFLMASTFAKFNKKTVAQIGI